MKCPSSCKLRIRKLPHWGKTRCDRVKWVKIETKIKSRKNRRKGIPLKNGQSSSFVDKDKTTTPSASDSSEGNGDRQLNSSSSFKLLLQVLNSMSSPPAMPNYNNRYPALNGYPQINGVDPAEPIDCRKLQSHRRYVERGFHRHKIKARNRQPYNHCWSYQHTSSWNLLTDRVIDRVLYIYHASLNQGKHTYVL